MLYYNPEGMCHMELLDKKHIIALAVLFLLYSLCGQWIYEQSGIYIHRAMSWNIILAILPYVCMIAFVKAERANHKALAALLLIIWLFLFPNVPYLMTDFIHISPLTFYIFDNTGTQYLREVMPWLELSHIALGVWFGMMVGYRSLYQLHHLLRHKYTAIYGWMMVTVVSILSGYGVFLGRFLRLNSWDILHPASLLREVIVHNDLFALRFTIFFSIFILVSYTIYYLVVYRKDARE